MKVIFYSFFSKKKKLFQGNIFKSVRSIELLPLLNRLMDGTVVGFQGYWILSRNLCAVVSGLVGKHRPARLGMRIGGT